MSELDELKKEVSMLLDKQKETNELLRRLEGMFTAQSKPDSDWIGEKEAAGMVRLQPEYFRRLCKSLDPNARLPINYLHRNNKNYQYYLPDIEQYLKDQSTLPKKKRA